MKNNQLLPLSRLRWACRRGMLELDVLLNNFLETAYLDLSLEDQACFVSLLTTEDPLLYTWLLGQDEPLNVDLKRIIGMIRTHGIRTFSV